MDKQPGGRCKKGKISNYLLLNQAFTDLYIGLTMWYDMGVSGTNNNLLLLIKSALMEYSLTLSLATLLLGAVERFLGITKPYLHKSYVTFHRLMCATSTVWCVSLLTPIVLLSLMCFDAVHHFDHPHVVVYSYVFDSVMLATILLVLTILLLTLKVANSSCTLQATLGKTHGSALLRQRKKTVNERKKVRLVVIFIIMMVGYVLTFLPLMIGRLLYDAGALETLSDHEETLLVTLLHCFYKSSALLNPFLTMLRKQDYRITLCNWLHGKRGPCLRTDTMKMQSRMRALSTVTTINNY